MKHLFAVIIMSLAAITIATPSFAGSKDNDKGKEKYGKDHNVPPGKPFDNLLVIVKALEKRIDELEKDNNALQTALDNETSARIAGDNNLQSEIDGLDATALEDRVAGIEDRVACVSDTSDSTNVYFDGCNVHVRNGLG